MYLLTQILLKNKRGKTRRNRNKQNGANENSGRDQTILCQAVLCIDPFLYFIIKVTVSEILTNLSKSKYIILRKLLSILFLCMVMLFQYGKILTYVNCRIENMINNNNAPCDCEKQIKNSADNTQKNPLQKTAVKEKITEELFTIESEKRIYHFSTENISLLKPSTTLLLTGFDKTIFQPPRI